MPTIFADIETLPDLTIPPDERAESVEPPANYKDPAKIAAYQAAKAEEQWRRGSLDPVRGMVLLIGVADGRCDPVILCGSTSRDEVLADPLAHERRTLDLFREFVIAARSTEDERANRKTTFVGHNIVRFDAPFLVRRAFKHGLYDVCRWLYASKPWDSPCIDTLLAWGGVDSRPGGTLDALADFVGIDRSGNPISGAEVYDRFAADDIDAVARHCLDDVAVVRELYVRLHRAGMAPGPR